MKIAFFDSGIGGISVLHQALQIMPNEDYLYYADTDHVPYGSKSDQDIVGFVDEAMDFIVKQDVKAVVVACNTATSVAIKSLRAKYHLPIVGMEPAIKPALDYQDECGLKKRILVIATPVTLRGDKLQQLLGKESANAVVDLLPLPNLVTFAEDFRFQDQAVKNYLRAELAPFSLTDYCAIVLGCTHFNFFRDTIKELMPSGTNIIDGSNGTVKHLHHLLAERNLLEMGGGTIAYFASGHRVSQEKHLFQFDQLLKRLDQLGL